MVKAKNDILTDISLHQGFMHLREIITKQRVSEGRAKQVWTLPNVSCFDRRSNNVKRENRRSSESKAMLAFALPSRDGGRLYVKRMADFLGHSNDLITLSLSLTLSGTHLQ